MLLFLLVTKNWKVIVKHSFIQNIKYKVLARLEQEDGYLTQVKVDKVFCFVSNVGSKISSNNAMPSRLVFLVKFLFACYKKY